MLFARPACSADLVLARWISSYHHGLYLHRAMKLTVVLAKIAAASNEAAAPTQLDENDRWAPNHPQAWVSTCAHILSFVIASHWYKLAFGQLQSSRSGQVTRIILGVVKHTSRLRATFPPLPPSDAFFRPNDFCIVIAPSFPPSFLFALLSSFREFVQYLLGTACSNIPQSTMASMAQRMGMHQADIYHRLHHYDIAAAGSSSDDARTATPSSNETS